MKRGPVPMGSDAKVAWRPERLVGKLGVSLVWARMKLLSGLLVGAGSLWVKFLNLVALTGSSLSATRLPPPVGRYPITQTD